MRRISRGVLPIVAAALLGLLIGPADMARADDQPAKTPAATATPLPPAKPATTTKAAPAATGKVAKSGKKAPTVVAKPTEIDHGHVYLLRGLANVWSRGMDSFGKTLTANGVRWSIHNHRKWQELADEAAKKYKDDKSFGPIIIVGHSLGADAAVLMAEQLGQEGVPVRLIVTFDGVARQSEYVSKVSANVAEVLNFYKSNGWGRPMLPSKGFKGKIDNVDMQKNRDVGHLNIDKDPELQARVLGVILATLNEKTVRSARN
jgi:thioesterase domain-containing protein